MLRPPSDSNEAEIVTIRYVMESFEEIARGYLHWRAKPWREVMEVAKRFAKEPILDLGSGTGRHSKPFLNKGYTVIAVDVAFKMVKLYYEGVSPAKRTLLSVIQADALYLPLRNSSIGTVLFIAVLHHIPTRKRRVRSLGEVRRVLKTNGTLIATVWSLIQPALFLKAILDYLRRTYTIFNFGDVYVPWKTRRRTIMRFYHLYTKWEMVKDLKEAGFLRFRIKTFYRGKILKKTNYLIVAFKHKPSRVSRSSLGAPGKA